MKIGESSLLLWVKSVSKHRRLWCPHPRSYTPQRNLCELTFNACDTQLESLSPPIATVLHKVVLSCLTFSGALLSLTPPSSLLGSSYSYESLIFFNKDKYDSWSTLSSPWEAEEDELGACSKRACLKQVVIRRTSFLCFQKASNWEKC